MKEYILNPTITFTTVASGPAPGKPADRATEAFVNTLLPAAVKPRPGAPFFQSAANRLHSASVIGFRARAPGERVESSGASRLAIQGFRLTVHSQRAVEFKARNHDLHLAV